MLDIIGKRTRFLLVSTVIILVGLIFLAIFGLEASIEFSSGSLLTLNFETKVDIDDLKNELYELNYANAIVQTTGEGDFLIRTEQITTLEKTELKDNLSQIFGSVEERGFENVDPVIASQTSRTAVIAIAIAAVGILLYITWAFRRMPKPIRYGACAVIALLHDALIALGVFAIIGGILNWQINMTFIIGILAVTGYSVNNTVVIFDRIRENLLVVERPDFQAIVNKSLIESLTRSLNTSLTTIIVVLALLLFIGSTIQNFAVVMTVGIIAGTFSSLFVAPSILVIWERNEWRRLLPLFSKR